MSLFSLIVQSHHKHEDQINCCFKLAYKIFLTLDCFPSHGHSNKYFYTQDKLNTADSFAIAFPVVGVIV